jgi:hypothetical protein
MQIGKRGHMVAHRLFGVRELGFRNPESNLDAVIREFLSIGEAVAARWIQMPNVVLLFQVVADDPASGAIYVYDRIQQEFYMLTFEGAEDNLTLAEFGEILSEYQLIQWSLHPDRLQGFAMQFAAA